MTATPPAKNDPQLDDETATLIGRRPHHASRSGIARPHWRLEYAERTNGDAHDDRGPQGVNRGQNWTSLSLPNPGGDDE